LEEAVGPKVRADREAEALRKRFGREFTLEEKRERLQAKTSANEAFRQASSQAEEALEAALAQRWSSVTGYVSELCLCIAAVFGDSQLLAQGCGNLADQFSLAPSTSIVESSPSPVLLGSFRQLAPLMEDKAPSQSVAWEAAAQPCTSPPEPPTVSVGPASPPSLQEAASVASLLSEASLATAEPPCSPPAASAPAPPVASGAPSVTEVSLPVSSSAPAAATAPTTGTESTSALQATATEELLPAATLAGDLTLSCGRMSESVQSLPAASLPAAAADSAAAPPPTLQQGQKVEVWSSSEKVWLPGLVEKVFVEAGVDKAAEQGKRFKVPAGSVKVVHAKGFKYVRQEHLHTAVRAC